jgi:hypothetical protein
VGAHWKSPVMKHFNKTSGLELGDHAASPCPARFTRLAGKAIGGKAAGLRKFLPAELF